MEKPKEIKFLSQFSLNSGDGCNLSVVPIHRVPNEMLDYIFTFLDIQERIQTERVCKRWRTLGVEQPWSEPKYLDFNYWRLEKTSMFGKWPITGNILWPLTENNLIAVLSRCGAILRGLTLSGSPSCRVPISGKTLGIIGKYCPNISEIDLVFRKVHLSRNCLAKLGESCKKLKVVRLTCNGEKEPLLQSFLQQCEGLESLAICGGKLCPKECDFEVINKNLKVLDLCRCYGFQTNALYKLMERCDGVQEFRLRGLFNYKFVTPEVLLKFVHYYCNTLKVLDLNFLPKNVIINWCAALSKLYKLEELHICSWGGVPFPCHSSENCFDVMSKNIKIFHARGFDNYFEEVFVKKLLAGNDSIQELHLMGCHNIFPEFLKLCLKYADSLRELVLFSDAKSCKSSNWCECFSTLRNLETLSLEFCGPEINDEVAQILANNCRKLKILNVGSTAITDTGLSYISSLPSLTQLDISYLDGITNKGVVVLATQGRIERLDLSQIHRNIGAEYQITDESCSLLARKCSRFRALRVENIVNISNELVSAFYKSIQEGYLKQNVVLYVHGTSVTRNCKKHHRLATIFTSQSVEEHA